MSTALLHDLKKLRAQAFHRAEYAEGTLRRYHSAARKLHPSVVQRLQRLYDWVLVPISLWPFNIQDVLDDCLAALEKGKRLNSRQRLIIEMLPEPPDDTTYAAVIAHEFQVQTGTYENLVKTQAKYSQNQLAICSDPDLHDHWSRIKAQFDVNAYRDHKGVIRRTMNVERNLRPSFSVNMRRQHEVFQAAFDAFCLRWNLFGMQNDEPLLLKLSVNLTPYGTMIHIPAYWSFDPKRDICWDAIAHLHRLRVPGRQGKALAEGHAQGIKDAEKLRQLDAETIRLGLKGQKKHDFLCAGLGWDPRTSARRISRLRAKFKMQRTVTKVT